MGKALKHIAGLLLAAMGAAFSLGCIAEIFDAASATPLWTSAFLFITLGLLPIATAVKLLSRTATELRQRRCPTCGSAERAPAGAMVTTHSPWMFYLGGWLLASLWGASREQQVRCTQCDSLYFTETKGTRIAGILLWVVIILVLGGTIADLFLEG